VSLILRRASDAGPVEVEGRAVRLVAIAPEVDPRTATIAATLEVDRSASELPIGSAVEAEILLAGERRGIVVPQSALIDDAGVAVAYVQDSGESFSRREVRILARQGSRALVDGVRARERLVTRGGAAIRRSSLLSSGAPEGHVH
jgi:multidrug efflux pump subunit AcrA (membrane-fusion protein)